METGERYPRLDTESRTRKRRYMLILIFGIVLLFLVSLLFRLQILEYGVYAGKVLNQITVGSSLAAERGEILDRNGNVLATNRTVWRIYISPIDIKKMQKRDGKAYDEAVARGLADILSLSYESILKKARMSAYLDQTIAKSADEETVRRVLVFAKENGLSSMIHTEAGTERYYPFGTLAAHTLGFTGSDNQGLSGLEAYYNAPLSGTDGKYLASVDSQGIKLPNAYTDYIEAERGLTLVTTIDLFMQRELEHQLEQAMLAADAKNRVTGVVMNVKSGDILAMATAPSFDLNDPYTLDDASLARLEAEGGAPSSAEYKALKRELLYKMWANKAVSEIYEPGSTFKIVTVAAALESRVVTPQNGFHCPGYYMVGGCRISCHKHGGHGSLTLAEGLMHSCNPVMMQIAERMGSETFYDYFTAFGYGKKTGIDLPGEALGLFHSKASLGVTELATASFGQRFKVSVLGQLCAIATVANGGVSVTPHLLSSFQKEGETVFTYRQNNQKRVISEETAKTVASILEAGVSGNGGAKNAYVEGYHVAAKTGTSEKFEILDAGGNSFLRIGSCVAFAPYDDAEIAVIIVVDEPSSPNKYGSMTAAPYISAYLTSVLPYLGVAKEDSGSTVAVPDVTGMDVKAAERHLSSLGLHVEIVGEGASILTQFPTAGTSMDKTVGYVILHTEESGAQDTAVPNVLGKTLKEATELLLKAGLNVSVLGASGNGTTAKDASVLTQSLPAGTRTARGTAVAIQIYHKNDTD